MGGNDKGEIKNILLQIDRINYKPESPFQESLEVRPGAFYFVWGPLFWRLLQEASSILLVGMKP